MNPLAKIGLAIGGAAVLCIITWFYRGHIDATETKAAVEAVQLKATQDHDKAVAKNREDQAAAYEKEKANQYAYQSNLQKLQHDLSNAVDTSNGLRNAVAAYASAYSNAAGGKEACAIPLQDAITRIGRLANLVTVVDSAGKRMAANASTCAVRLTACERWKAGVESEYGVTP